MSLTYTVQQAGFQCNVDQTKPQNTRVRAGAVRSGDVLHMCLVVFSGEHAAEKMSGNGGPNEMAENANRCLLSAALFGSVEGVNAALEAGADIDFDQLDVWNPGDDTTLPPSTPLLIACQKGHMDVVRLLLRKGASLVKRAMGAMTPLHVAAAEGWTEVVELLVQHGATLDIQDGFYDTPIIGACRYKHVDTVRRLIELGARPDLTDGDVGQRLWREVENCDSVEESIKLVQEARKSKLLRCCNPKCGKPGYRKTLKLCGRCKLTRYCSRDCQKQHWSVGHKKCCGHDAYTEERPDLEKKFLLYLEEHAPWLKLMKQYYHSHNHYTKYM